MILYPTVLIRKLSLGVKSIYKVILVEDEPSVLKNLALKIEQSGIKSFQVAETAYTGEEAWKKIQEGNIDVVISDIRMPGLGGLWLFEQIKNTFPNIICIALSAYSEFEYLQQCIRIQIEDYLLKPISVEQMKEKLESIEKMLKKKEQDKEEHLYVKNDTDVCEKIDQYIKIHYQEKVSLNQMSDTLGYSAQYMSELYKKGRGIPLGEAILQYRLKKAQHLIRKNPDISFVKIAEIVGYPDYRYFSRLFKKRFGITLSEFKDQEEKKDE